SRNKFAKTDPAMNFGVVVPATVGSGYELRDDVARREAVAASARPSSPVIYPKKPGDGVSFAWEEGESLWDLPDKDDEDRRQAWRDHRRDMMAEREEAKESTSRRKSSRSKRQVAASAAASPVTPAIQVP